MPFPSGTFLNEMRAWAGAVANEFDHLYAQLEGWLRKEHHEDGTHGNVTADSLTLTVNAATGATGNATVGGYGTFNGNVTADADGSPVVLGDMSGQSAFSEPGIAIKKATTNWWEIGAELGTFSASPSLIWRDVANPNGVSAGIMGLVRESAINTTPADYYLKPPTTSTPNLYLGKNSANERWAEVNTKILRATTVVSVSTATTAAQITANQNNYSVSSFAPTVFVSADAARDITGFANGVTGQRIKLFNTSAFTITIRHASASSSSGNRVACPAFGDFALLSGMACEIEKQAYPTDANIGWFLVQL